jgi:hypothetical protein
LNDFIALGIDFAYNPNLRFIGLDLSSRFLPNPRDWVSALCQITLPRVERVMLNIHFDCRFGLEAVDWPGIDHCFTQERWASLHKLTFVLWSKEREAEYEWVKAELPLLGDRAVLKVPRSDMSSGCEKEREVREEWRRVVQFEALMYPFGYEDFLYSPWS